MGLAVIKYDFIIMLRFNFIFKVLCKYKLVHSLFLASNRKFLLHFQMRELTLEITQNHIESFILKKCVLSTGIM